MWDAESEGERSDAGPDSDQEADSDGGIDVVCHLSSDSDGEDDAPSRAPLSSRAQKRSLGNSNVSEPGPRARRPTSATGGATQVGWCDDDGAGDGGICGDGEDHVEGDSGGLASPLTGPGLHPAPGGVGQGGAAHVLGHAPDGGSSGGGGSGGGGSGAGVGVGGDGGAHGPQPPKAPAGGGAKAPVPPKDPMGGWRVRMCVADVMQWSQQKSPLSLQGTTFQMTL